MGKHEREGGPALVGIITAASRDEAARRKASAPKRKSKKALVKLTKRKSKTTEPSDGRKTQGRERNGESNTSVHPIEQLGTPDAANADGKQAVESDAAPGPSPPASPPDASSLPRRGRRRMSSTGAYTEPAPQSKWRTGSKKEDHLQQVLAERASKEGLKMFPWRSEASSILNAARKLRNIRDRLRV